MAWEPKFRVIRGSRIADNLLAFVAANQADALLWAHGSPLRPIAEFASSVANRTSPVYPSIAFLRDAGAQDFTLDHLPGTYGITFELLVQNADPNVAVAEARGYESAVTSMIRNCPDATAAAGTGASSAVLESIETEFAEIRTNEMQNDFLQQIQIRATYRLLASAY